MESAKKRMIWYLANPRASIISWKVYFASEVPCESVCGCDSDGSDRVASSVNSMGLIWPFYMLLFKDYII